MKTKLLLVMMFFVNCYLTDLEEYKYYEKHNDFITAYSFSNTIFDINGKNGQLLYLTFEFTIKRNVYFDFFSGDDTSKPSSLISFKDNPPKQYNPGTYDKSYYVLYDPTHCDSFLTLRIRAESDVDTLTQYFKIRKNLRVFCEKGGIDSQNVKIGFGNTKEYKPFVDASNRSVLLNSPCVNPLYVVSKFSKKYSKPFIMIYNTFNDTSTFNFITPSSLDSLPDRPINGIRYNLFVRPTYSNSIDRDFLCTIWKSYPIDYSNDQHIAEPGKMYPLIYSTFLSGVEFVSLISVKNVVYTDSISGYLDCVLYMLN